MIDTGRLSSINQITGLVSSRPAPRLVTGQGKTIQRKEPRHTNDRDVLHERCECSVGVTGVGYVWRLATVHRHTEEVGRGAPGTISLALGDEAGALWCSVA